MNSIQPAVSESAIVPLVSVITPNYNRADLIGETLQSLGAQTMPLWECIVVDDGSSDDSVEVVSAFATTDSRIRLLVRDRVPKGAGTCRNIAVENACGRYVLFLDSDDLLAPFCLEQRVSVLESDSRLDFAIFPMLLFDRSVDDADRLWNIDTGEDDLLRLLHGDPVCQGTGTLWRRDSFIRVGMWNERLTIWQDVELHLRAFTGGFRYVKRFDLPPDAYLRDNAGSLSRGAYHSREKLESRAEVVRTAVRLLRDSGRVELLPEVRYLCSSVVLGAARSGNLDLARELRTWGRREGVWRRGDSWRLMVAELGRVSRLDRIPFVRSLRDDLTKRFSQTKSTLGQIRRSSIHSPAVPASNTAAAS